MLCACVALGAEVAAESGETPARLGLQNAPELIKSLCELVGTVPQFEAVVALISVIRVDSSEGSFYYDPSCNSADLYADNDSTNDHEPRPSARQMTLMERDATGGAGRIRITGRARFKAFDGVGYKGGAFRQQLDWLELRNVERVPKDVPWPWEHSLPAPLDEAAQQIALVTARWYVGVVDDKQTHVLGAVADSYVVVVSGEGYHGMTSAWWHGARDVLAKRQLLDTRLFINGDAAVWRSEVSLGNAAGATRHLACPAEDGAGLADRVQQY